MSLFFSKYLPLALQRPFLFDSELLLALLHQLLCFQDHLFSSLRVHLVLLHDLLHLDGFGLRPGMHFKALSLPLGFELQMLLFHLPLALLKLKSLALQCQLGGTLSLLQLSFSLKALLGGSPLPLPLGMCLEFSALAVSLVHFLLAQFHLSLLFGNYALGLCLELLLLFLAQLLLHLRLDLPLVLDLPLLGNEFLLLPVLLLRALLLLESLKFSLLAQPLLLSPLAFILLELSEPDLLHASHLLLPLLDRLLLVALPDPLQLQLHLHHLLHLLLLPHPDLLNGTLLFLYHG